MNDRDVRLMQSMMVSIGDATKGGIVLIDVKSTQFVRADLVLLKLLSEQLQMPGIFVSGDRPHQYITHLLKMHQINPARLTFVDLIGRYSGDKKQGTSKAGFVDGPFHVGSIPETLAEWKAGIDDDGLDLGNCRFAIIENIASLLTYNSYASVESFLRNIVSILRSNASMLVVLMIDRDRSQLLYETARTLCTKEISVEGISHETIAGTDKSFLSHTDSRYTQGEVRG